MSISWSESRTQYPKTSAKKGLPLETNLLHLQFNIFSDGTCNRFWVRNVKYFFGLFSESCLVYFSWYYLRIMQFTNSLFLKFHVEQQATIFWPWLLYLLLGFKSRERVLFRVADLYQVWESSKELWFCFPFILFQLSDENLVKIDFSFRKTFPQIPQSFLRHFESWVWILYSHHFDGNVENGLRISHSNHAVCG